MYCRFLISICRANSIIYTWGLPIDLFHKNDPLHNRKIDSTLTISQTSSSTFTSIKSHIHFYFQSLVEKTWFVTFRKCRLYKHLSSDYLPILTSVKWNKAGDLEAMADLFLRLRAGIINAQNSYWKNSVVLRCFRSKFFAFPAGIETIRTTLIQFPFHNLESKYVINMPLNILKSTSRS